MRRAADTPTRRRAGFTLIELVVVISIILTLLAIAVAVVPSASSRAANTGADRLQGWLLIAKQRALRDQAPRGIRLVIDPAHPNYITELNYIESPDPYTPPPTTAVGSNVVVPRTLRVTAPAAANAPWFADVSPPDPNVNATPGAPSAVSRGDYLEIIGDANLRRITDINPPNGSPGGPTPPGVTRFVLIPYPNPGEGPFGMNPGTTGTTMSFTSGFRFFRQPQPLMGEPALLMPKNSGILYNPAQQLTNPPPPPQPNSIYGFGEGGYPIALNQPFVPGVSGPITDFMFAPGGGMVTPRINGNVVLWVFDTTQANATDGGPTLITIYSRTGAIAAHPVDLLNQPFQFYSFTRDGKNSGM